MPEIKSNKPKEEAPKKKDDRRKVVSAYSEDGQARNASDLKKDRIVKIAAVVILLLLAAGATVWIILAAQR